MYANAAATTSCSRSTKSSIFLENSVHHCALGREVQQPGTNTIYMGVYCIYRMYYIWYLAYAYDNNNSLMLM